MGFAVSDLLLPVPLIAYVGLLIILYVAVEMLLGGAVKRPYHLGFLSGWFGGGVGGH